MAKNTIKVEATYLYELEVDAESLCVNDYVSEDDMIEDLVHYRFSTLPVLKDGVKIKDFTVDCYKIVSKTEAA